MKLSKKGLQGLMMAMGVLVAGASSSAFAGGNVSEDCLEDRYQACMKANDCEEKKDECLARVGAHSYKQQECEIFFEFCENDVSFAKVSRCVGMARSACVRVFVNPSDLPALEDVQPNTKIFIQDKTWDFQKQDR